MTYDRVRTKKRKFQAGETREIEVNITGREKFKVEAYFAILDRLKNEQENICVTVTIIFMESMIF